MKSIFKIFCVACILGVIGCSQDITQVVDKESGKDLNVPSIKLDTTHLNITIEDVTLNNEDTQKAIAELSQTNSPTTRAIKLDDKGKIKGEQKFTAICYLLNTKTNHLGQFELDWTIKKNGTKITLEGNSNRNINIVWKHGTKLRNIEGSNWEICGIAGGGKSILKGNPSQPQDCEAVSFEPKTIDEVNNGEVAIPFISNYRPVRFTDKKIARLNFSFNFVGTLIKLKLKRDNSVTQDENFFFNTTGLNPIGVFLMQDLTTKNPKQNKELKDLWTSTAPIPENDNQNANKYQLLLRGDKALTLNEGSNQYFIWYVWGMPHKDISVVETTMGSLDGGYIIKQDGKQGPLWSKHHFKNDEGKVKTFNLSIHAPEPYPSFNFLNILERVAEHNLESSKTWWTSDVIRGKKDRFTKKPTVDQSVFFSYDDAVNPDNMPDGYHLPSLDEMTILFPYQAKYNNGADDIKWKQDFTNKTSPWKEWVPLYAYQDKYVSNNKNVWVVCDNPAITRNIATASSNKQTILNRFNDRNVKEFNSYIYNRNNGAIFYSIRFAENSAYGNKIRCAYKWDFSEVGAGKKGYVDITCRWIGDSPVTIDEITNDWWWSHNRQYNKTRRLPAEGEFEAGKFKSIAQGGAYMCSGKYELNQGGGSIFNRIFNGEWHGGSLQRKNYEANRGLVRPFKNAMMCNEKSSYEGGNEKLLEENTGKGTGQVLK